MSLYESPWHVASFELTDRLAAERGVEVRYPFLDRRLVELGLQLPEDQVKTGSAHRGLHRLAFGDRLPRSVAGRTDKAEFSGSFRRRVEASLTPSAAEAALASLGDRINATRLRTSDASIWQWWAVLSAGTFLSEDAHR